MLQIQKDEKEYVLLIEHYKKSKTRLMRERVHCILLSMQGNSPPKIAEILFRDEDTIRGWIKSYDTHHLTSIFPKYSGNTNASKLTADQLAEIQQTISSSPDSASGLPGAFWSLKKLKGYISAMYGVVYESDRSYHHIFTLSNFSFKLPEGFDKRRDDTLVAQRMQEISKAVQQKQREGYEIFYADECSLSWETEYRRVWLPKGKKTILRVNREKSRVHYFGALNAASKKEELIKLDWQNTDNIIEALRELRERYKEKKLCIVWDNARWHRSRQLKELLGKDKEFEHLHFIWLPPYAPDHNPQERVWRIAKDTTANTVTQTFHELQDIFEQAIAGKRFDYKMSGI